MDKIEKIRQEIERLIEMNHTKNGFPAGTMCAVRIEAYEHLLTFLDTLSEEPDKSLEEEYKDYVENDPVYSKLVNRNAGLGIARHFAEWGAEHLK